MDVKNKKKRFKLMYVCIGVCLGTHVCLSVSVCTYAYMFVCGCTYVCACAHRKIYVK